RAAAGDAAGGVQTAVRGGVFLAHQVSEMRPRRAARDGHDGHVHRLVVVLPSLRQPARQNPAVRLRARESLDAGRPVHGRRRARDPAPPLLALFHEGSARRGAGGRGGALGAAVDAVALRRKVAQTVGKVTEHYDELRFNTAVAFLMELANAMQDYLRGGGARDAAWDGAVHTLVKLLNPLAPHVGEEMWERLGEKGLLADASWPAFEASAAAEPKVVLVVQVSGKLRDRLEVDAGLSEADAVRAALASEKVRAALDGGSPSKIIYVQDRLINLVP